MAIELNFFQRGGGAACEHLVVVDNGACEESAIAAYNDKSGRSKFIIVAYNDESVHSKFIIVACNDKSGHSKFIIVAYNDE